MGNNIATMSGDTEPPRNMSQLIDYIATYYILTTDFESLRKLYDREYCDKLTVITSNIMERYFTDMDVTYLARRLKEGDIESYDDDNKPAVNELTNKSVIFYNKDEIGNLDSKPRQKRRICVGIAKFYIKIAHVFAAIVTTLNPTYVYKNEFGEKQMANLYQKSKIPPNVPRKVVNYNLCDNRIRRLSRGMSRENKSEVTQILHPDVCSVPAENVEQEVGIPELMVLYYDSIYDYKTGKFTGMSDKTREQYQNDLKAFYEVFVGTTMPPEIKSFSDIKLRNYASGCQTTQDEMAIRPPPLDTKLTMDSSDTLFKEYAQNLKDMMQNSNTNRDALLKILEQLFVYTINPVTQNKQIRINPKLTEEGVQKIVEKTRGLIIRLYLTCEKDYHKGVQIYESLVEKLILKTAQNQIENLERQKGEG